MGPFECGHVGRYWRVPLLALDQAALVLPSLPDPAVVTDKALPLAICWPDQCCTEYCVDEVGLHNVDRETAEGVAEAAGRLVVSRVAQAEAPLRALVAETACYITKTTLVTCRSYIGATFPGGGEWVEAMCCLPCRVRAGLASPAESAPSEPLSR